MDDLQQGDWVRVTKGVMKGAIGRITEFNPARPDRFEQEQRVTIDVQGWPHEGPLNYFEPASAIERLGRIDDFGF